MMLPQQEEQEDTFDFTASSFLSYGRFNGEYSIRCRIYGSILQKDKLSQPALKYYCIVKYEKALTKTPYTFQLTDIVQKASSKNK